MRRLAVCLVAALALACTATASAKEVTAAKVCGKSACRTIKERRTLALLGEGGEPTDPPDHPSGWYRLRITTDVGGGQRRSFWTVVVPAAGMLRGTDELGRVVWLPVSAKAARRYRAITRGLAPRPAGALRGLERAPAPRPSPPVTPQAARPHLLAPVSDASQSGAGMPDWAWVAAALTLAAAVAALPARALRRRS